MARAPNEQSLMTLAMQADQDALGQLLLLHYDRLERYLRRKIPSDLRPLLAVEDVIQDAHIQAFRNMNQFKAEGQNSFSRWLVTIAKNCLLNRIKEHNRLKRGRGYKRAQSPAKTSSIASLVAVVAEDTRTPSRSAARHERQRAVQVGLASLKEDHRTALTLRYLDALPVADIAKRMDRTEHAVHMLCNRGIKKLKGVLGSGSKYASGG